MGTSIICFRDTFSTSHRDLVTEHFNKEANGTALHFPSGYSTDIYLCRNKWIKTFQIHSKMRSILRQKLHVFTSQFDKEMTPGNKRLHFEHFEHAHNLKASLKQYSVNIFGDGPGRNLTTSREIDNGVTDGVSHVQKTLETNVAKQDSKL